MIKNVVNSSEYEFGVGNKNLDEKTRWNKKVIMDEIALLIVEKLTPKENLHSKSKK
jgi:hypothetical protein